MDSFKTVARGLSEQKKELRNLRTADVRKKLVEAASKADGAALRCEDCHIRLIKQKSRRPASKVSILAALKLMEEPTLHEFLLRLNGICENESEVLRVTKGTRATWLDADETTRALAAQLLGIREKRKGIRDKIKVLQQDYDGKEAELMMAMKEDGKTAFAGEGISVQVKPRFTRTRVNLRDAEHILLPIFDEPGTTDINELAVIIFEALNPKHQTDRLVVKF